MKTTQRKLRLVAITTLLFGILAFTIGSCKKEMKYSCDPKAENYAIENMEANQSISRDSLVKLPRIFQFAVFNSLSSANKKRIFNEKIDILLAADSFDIEEKAALLNAKNYSNLEFYNSPDTLTDTFLINWQQHAVTVFGWSQDKIQRVLGTWMTGPEIELAAAIYDMADKAFSCSCLYDAGCAGFGDCNRSVSCEKVLGCGLFGSSYCYGTCPEDRAVHNANYSSNP